jgi:hypothetical protein
MSEHFGVHPRDVQGEDMSDAPVFNRGVASEPGPPNQAPRSAPSDQPISRVLDRHSAAYQALEPTRAGKAPDTEGLSPKDDKALRAAAEWIIEAWDLGNHAEARNRADIAVRHFENVRRVDNDPGQAAELTQDEIQQIALNIYRHDV